MWAKRISLFLITNILIMLVISTIISLLGIEPYLNSTGINYQSLMIMCLLWGMGGSFISLWISKWMAKTSMGLRPIDERGHMGHFVQMVHRIARQAGLTTMPEVYYFDSPDMNAFATGPSRNNSLVAVSTGLIRGMREEEVEAVLAHEVAHVANGDMVTMALIQGVMNAFVMFFARLATFAIDQALRGDRDDNRGGGLGFFAYIMLNNLFQMIFGILAAPVVMGFSRWREYRADAGSAAIVGREKMIAALRALQRNYEVLMQKREQPARNVEVMQISSRGAFMELFASHPPLEKRIAALQNR
ncbi:MAG: protease HtpX [Bdellovibrio sp. CG12_big_fil_rev_8_21_14_0_65_39_13]|nr:MAG: protease HtpX [Bdellovibrio sp. CG22_combo_CG10-13_8_21_14_all_39_27]PIQ60295.1 MAG: protease HtpX [Bdellovibrio sp. CG12_big_fil_rev_8_21_14_0_65_39_13]PIR34732.1 MAG: protease HtpX [Bdellovibrio sp. CG11_big_fil_rev_8_21_14_0_20_39_38]